MGGGGGGVKYRSLRLSFTHVNLHQCHFHSLMQDATLNKITRNLSDTHPQYLGVGAQFRHVYCKYMHV